MSRGAHLSMAVLLLAWGLQSVARADDLSEQKKRLSEARSAVTKGKVAVTLAARKIQHEFEATPEWKQADAASKQAEARYAAAVRVARASLNNNPAYKQAMDERAKRETELNALKTAEERDPQAIAAASVALLKAVETTSRLDQEALAADPKVAEAKAGLDAAAADMNELRKAEVQRVKDSPEFQAAREQLQQASAAYDQASGELNQARKDQAAADAQNLDAEIEGKRRQMLDAAQRR